MKEDKRAGFKVKDAPLFNGNKIITCSKCKEEFEVKSGIFNFCPACGRKIQ